MSDDQFGPPEDPSMALLREIIVAGKKALADQQPELKAHLNTFGRTWQRYLAGQADASSKAVLDQLKSAVKDSKNVDAQVEIDELQEAHDVKPPKKRAKAEPADVAREPEREPLTEAEKSVPAPKDRARRLKEPARSTPRLNMFLDRLEVLLEEYRAILANEKTLASRAIWERATDAFIDAQLKVLLEPELRLLSLACNKPIPMTVKPKKFAQHATKAVRSHFAKLRNDLLAGYEGPA